MINNLLGRENNSKSIKKLIDPNGTVIDTPSKIAENFNNFFANIAGNLKEENNRNLTGSHDHNHFLENPVSNSIYLNQVTSDEIYNIINNFKNKYTLDIRTSSLKIANTSIKFTHTLAKIIDKSFTKGVFPEQLKSVRVVPIHKEGSKTDVENYRPISLLASISKVYGKLMHSRIINFLDSNNA